MQVVLCHAVPNLALPWAEGSLRRPRIPPSPWRLGSGAGTFIVKDYATSQKIFERKRAAIRDSAADISDLKCDGRFNTIRDRRRGQAPAEGGPVPSGLRLPRSGLSCSRKDMYNCGMIRSTHSSPSGFSRRRSPLGELLAKRQLDDARRLSPEQRLLLALQLSDVCYELHRACSAKR